MALTPIELWRLSDELSVVDAAILITGNDPSNKSERYDDEGHSIYDTNGVPEHYQRTNYEGFDPVFKALRTAIFANKLKATLGAKARNQVYNYEAYGNPEHLYGDGELEMSFDLLIQASGYSANIFTNRKVEHLHRADSIYVLEEPDWTETMVNVDDLKDWLSSRGLHPTFFFPEGKAEGFRDKNHPRYSAKLACAVAAWEAIDRAQPRKSVKETITAWVNNNAVQYGLANESGIVPKLSVEDVAKVVNWATTGGATPTSVVEDDDDNEVEIQNFSGYSNPNNADDVPF
jgi:hypothetical protein